MAISAKKIVPRDGKTGLSKPVVVPKVSVAGQAQRHESENQEGSPGSAAARLRQSCQDYKQELLDQPVEPLGYHHKAAIRSVSFSHEATGHTFSPRY